jgi:hypothetical protein
MGVGLSSHARIITPVRRLSVSCTEISLIAQWSDSLHVTARPTARQCESWTGNRDSWIPFCSLFMCKRQAFHRIAVNPRDLSRRDAVPNDRCQVWGSAMCRLGAGTDAELENKLDPALLDVTPMDRLRGRKRATNTNEYRQPMARISDLVAPHCTEVGFGC